MEIVKLINQNIPIWSMLCGDHALKNSVMKINPQLLNNPNFLDPLENELRLTVFKNNRDWIFDTMKQRASFALISFTMKDLETFNTCFQKITFKKFRNEYENAYENQSGFEIAREYKDSIVKRREDVEIVAKTLSTKIVKDFKKLKTKVNADMVCDQKYSNDNIFIAANRGLIMKTKGNSLTIMDGTHRLTAYSLTKRNIPKLLPNYLYAFHWEEV